MRVTFPASVLSDSDTSQISREGKGGINGTVDPIPISIGAILLLPTLYLYSSYNFKNRFHLQQKKSLKTTKQDDLQGQFWSQPSGPVL